MAVALYIVQHLLSVLLINKNTRHVYALIGLAIFLTIAVIKEDAYDLIPYTQALDTGYYGHFELMFVGLIDALKNFTDIPIHILILIQASLSAMVMLTAVFFRRKFFNVCTHCCFIVISSDGFK